MTRIVDIAEPVELMSKGRSVGFASPRYFAIERKWYSPYINRFLSADTIVPSSANPQNLNRYSYVLNNPLRYTDPSGHRATECDLIEGCGSVSQAQKDKDAQTLVRLKSKSNDRKCSEGNKDYCSGYSHMKDNFKTDVSHMLNDMWDGLNNPMSGVGFGYFAQPICQALKRVCSSDTVDIGIDVVSRAYKIVSTGGPQQWLTPSSTPTLFISPTAEPTSTLAIPTMTTTPTLTVTPSITSTPSSTLTQPALTSTPRLTPVYWVP